MSELDRLNKLYDECETVEGKEYLRGRIEQLRDTRTDTAIVDECIDKAVALGRDTNFLGEDYEGGYYQCRLEILEALSQVRRKYE